MQPVTAPRSLKEKQRHEREELILQAAEEVLAEKGFFETSVDEIAARVGIAKGTVYLHFPGKEDLVIAILERNAQKMLDIVESTVASASTNREKLEAILRVVYGGFFDPRTSHLMQLPYLVVNGSELRRVFVDKKGCMRDKWDRMDVLITSILEEGKAAGEFDNTLPTPVMVSAFFSLLSPRSYERLNANTQMPIDEFVKQLGRFYFKGIATVQKD
ncbi:MAG TPA: TetR/AcrR family transcriptional regulator [Ktedonobacteraceae bacterium]|nr:TetR/AcrR family transcriptional regulator [Ktedonobacteraceae bacterium]